MPQATRSHHPRQGLQSKLRLLTSNRLTNTPKSQGWVLLLVLAAASLGCHQEPRSGSLRRIAIVPFNLLTDEPSSDPMRLGGAIVLQEDLLSSPAVTVQAVTSDADGYGFGATETVQVTVTRAGTKLRGELTDIDPASHRTLRVLTAEAASYVGLANRFAKLMDDRAGSFSSTNDSAVRAYVSSLETADRGQREQALRKALQLDPRFGLAYLALAELSANQPGGVADVLAQAQAQSGGFTPLDGARLLALSARANAAGAEQQASAMQKVVELAPNDVESLSALGADKFLAGDPAAGEKALRKAAELAPDRGEIRHQLALGLLAAGRFDAAAEVFRSLRDEAWVPSEMAACLLLRGDERGADKVMQQYFTARRAQLGTSLPLIRANWTAISQGLEKGAAELASGQFATPDLASVAASQRAIWIVAAGHATEAAPLAATGIRAAASPMARAYAVAAGAAAAPVSNDPRAQLGQMPMEPGMKALIAGYTLFLHGQYTLAADVWAAMVKQSGQQDLKARAMLAASLNRAGRVAEAAHIRVQPFAPNLGGSDPYAAISFVEMRRLLPK